MILSPTGKEDVVLKPKTYAYLLRSKKIKRMLSLFKKCALSSHQKSVGRCSKEVMG